MNGPEMICKTIDELPSLPKIPFPEKQAPTFFLACWCCEFSQPISDRGQIGSSNIYVYTLQLHGIEDIIYNIIYNW